MTAFEELGVIPQLGEAVSTIGWNLPTAIQSEAVPAILGGGDVLIAAETGSGKTGAFCLPVTQIVWERRKDALVPNKGPKTIDVSWKLDLSDRDAGLSIGQDGLNCESRTPKQWFGARATAAVHSAGKYYYEVKITRDGLCRVGWATGDGTRDIGKDNKSFGFGGTGKKAHAKQFDDYGTSFTTGDVLGCFLDLTKKAMWWSKNGTEFPVAFKVPDLFLSPFNGLHPAVLVQNSSLLVNFGDQPFAYPPAAQSGFIGVSSARSEYVQWKSADAVAVDPKAPLCIIMEPTRELIEQTHNNLVIFTSKLRDPPIRCVSLATGVPLNKVLDDLRAGCDIVTGTPQRIVDLVETNELSLKGLQFVVIDEADQFLTNRNGAAHLLDIIFKKLPLVTGDGSRLQIIVCSATLHNPDIRKFADKHLHFPQWIDLKGMDSVAETVHHVVCAVDASSDKQWIRLMHAPDHLQDDGVHAPDELKIGSTDKNTISLGTKLLKGIYVLKAIEAMRMEQCIVFCRTKQQCDHMETFLNAHGYRAICLHGDRTPQERSESLRCFKEKIIPFLVCTDVAARGIDVSGVPFVINVTMPDEKEMYVHRIGRVGRAERMGLSISLVSSNEEKVWYHSCRSRGVNCKDTRDKQRGGCTIWYDEVKLLSEVEEMLGQTIATVDSDFRVPVDDFEGKITYGAKRSGAGALFEGHAPQLATSVAQLADLERALQSAYLAAVLPNFRKMTVL